MLLVHVSCIRTSRKAVWLSLLYVLYVRISTPSMLATAPALAVCCMYCKDIVVVMILLNMVVVLRCARHRPSQIQLDLMCTQVIHIDSISAVEGGTAAVPV